MALRARWRALRRRLSRMLRTIEARVPFGARFLVGILLMVGGVFGALPVLGFWMLPLGVMVAAIDIRALRRWINPDRG